jgi:hypothetical protein
VPYLPQQLHQVQRGGGVQAAGWLVQHEYGRVYEQLVAHAHAFALTACRTQTNTARKEEEIGEEQLRQRLLAVVSSVILRDQ